MPTAPPPIRRGVMRVEWMRAAARSSSGDKLPEPPRAAVVMVTANLMRGVPASSDIGRGMARNSSRHMPKARGVSFKPHIASVMVPCRFILVLSGSSSVPVLIRIARVAYRLEAARIVGICEAKGKHTRQRDFNSFDCGGTLAP